MSTARFLGPARQEFLTEVAYYDQAQAGLGQRFAIAVEAAASRALAFPHAGALTASGARKVTVKGFPYSVIYQPEPSGIVILAVAHHARKPGYWKLRK